MVWKGLEKRRGAWDGREMRKWGGRKRKGRGGRRQKSEREGIGIGKRDGKGCIELCE